MGRLRVVHLVDDTTAGGVMRVVVRVGYVAVPVFVRVVMVLNAMRVQTTLGQPKASQADRTDAQP